MRMTSASEYAMRIMGQMVHCYDKSTLTAEELSHLENIQRDYVDQLLLKLRRAKLIQSRRGAQGGYRLSLAPEKITVADVVEAVERDLLEDTCDKYSYGKMQCRHTVTCSIRPIWRALAQKIENFLRGVTLDELQREEVEAEKQTLIL
ncbi:MAG: Rrf2 family transcriptional regulator [Elusimicrobia bacterium]|nr:Rrf2 family transcriptional regulator [Elusimicrobiota bacterium]